MTGITVQFGTSGGTPITGPCDPGTAFTSLVFVTISASAGYQQGDPDGPLPGHFPTRPHSGPGVWYPQLIPQSDRRQYWFCEGSALVNSGIGAFS